MPCLAAEVIGVLLGEVVPLFGQIVKSENRRNRTNGNAGATVDAFDRIDIQDFDLFKPGIVLFGVNAVYGAGVDAGGILGAYAGFSDNICHV